MKNLSKKQILIICIVSALTVCIYNVRFSEQKVPGVFSTEDSSPADGMILFKGLSNDEKSLPPLPTDEGWSEIISSHDVFRDRILEDTDNYGDIAKRYYSSNDYEYLFIDINEVDVTGDGKPEHIVSFDGGGTYGILFYEIVKDDKIVATIKSESVGRGARISPDLNGNDFTMIWYTQDMFPEGYCCPTEQMVTVFTYEDDNFIPVSERRESVI